MQGSWDGSYDDDDDDNGAEGPAAKALRSLEQQVVSSLQQQSRACLSNAQTTQFTGSKKPSASFLHSPATAAAKVVCGLQQHTALCHQSCGIMQRVCISCSVSYAKRWCLMRLFHQPDTCYALAHDASSNMCMAEMLCCIARFKLQRTTRCVAQWMKAVTHQWDQQLADTTATCLSCLSCCCCPLSTWL